MAITGEHSALSREKVYGIHHVGITVGDLDRSLVFYRDLLQMRLIGISVETVGEIVGSPGASARIADLDAGGGQLVELIDYGTRSGAAAPRDPEDVGSCHISIEVDDLPDALARLRTAGHRPMGEVTELSLGGVWNGCTIAYVRDPDGVVIELLQGPRDPDATVDG